MVCYNISDTFHVILCRTKDGSFKFTMTQIHQRHPSVIKPFQEEYNDPQIRSRFFEAANKMRRQGLINIFDEVFIYSL